MKIQGNPGYLVIKNPSANAGDIRDTCWVPGWEGSLEKVLATYSSILAWRNPVDRQQRSLTGNRLSDVSLLLVFFC